MCAATEQAIRFWRAQAFLARHSGRFDLAAQYEEYALAEESGRPFAGIGRGIEHNGDSVAAASVSLDVAHLAINIAYTGHA